ncbi:MAG: hypothetical protein DIU68_006420 [Chloroflexota bacterium]|nr:MAG: hypothetical protein DIU68_19440 [Chloroflexota bacterium]
MAFDFVWDDEARRVIRYRAMGQWNWNDFHRTVRVSTFHLDNLDHPVETVLDLRQSARTPAGAVGHLRSLGKKDHANRLPRAIVIGLDAETQRALGAVDGVYRANEQLIRFVDSEEEAQAILAEWMGEKD